MKTDRPLTKKEKKFCEYWLCFWTVLSENLTSEKFGEQELGLMIAYELQTRRRRRVLKMLTGRYFKLLRKRNWHNIVAVLEENNADPRKNNRTISLPTSEEDGRSCN